LRQIEEEEGSTKASFQPTTPMPAPVQMPVPQMNYQQYQQPMMMKSFSNNSNMSFNNYNVY
jgi:hypothetical protein